MPNAAQFILVLLLLGWARRWVGNPSFLIFFADGIADTHLVALGTLLGSLFTAFVSGLVILFNTLHKAKQETKARHFREQEIILDRQEKQIARLGAQAIEQQKVINHIHDLHADCRSETAQLRLYLSVLLEYIRRQQKAGILTEPPPDLPEALRVRPDDAEFAVKTTAQNTILVTELDAKIQGSRP